MALHSRSLRVPFSRRSQSVPMPCLRLNRRRPSRGPNLGCYTFGVGGSRVTAARYRFPWNGRSVDGMQLCTDPVIFASSVNTVPNAGCHDSSSRRNRSLRLYVALEMRESSKERAWYSGKCICHNDSGAPSGRDALSVLHRISEVSTLLMAKRFNKRNNFLIPIIPTKSTLNDAALESKKLNPWRRISDLMNMR